MTDPSDAQAVRRAHLRASFDASAEVKRLTVEVCAGAISEAAGVLIDTLAAGGKVLTFGNGGSAADAQHFADELAGRFDRERPALPALALTANTSDLTAIGNDYGFDHVFARLIQAHGRPGDLALGITTSGNSPNVLQAMAEARARGLRSIGLIGKGGGKLASMVDVPIVVPSDVTARIQETHITVLHVLCELIDAALYPGAHVVAVGRIVLREGDITEEAVDALVNAANSDLVLGSGVAGAIRERGGPSIQAECDAIGPIGLGDAAVTGAGALPAGCVVHAAGMPPGGHATEDSVRRAMSSSLVRARERGCRTIAIPAIGAGVGGLSPQRCAEILIAEARTHLAGETSIEEIRFVLYGEPMYRVFEMAHDALKVAEQMARLRGR